MAPLSNAARGALAVTGIAGRLGRAWAADRALVICWGLLAAATVLPIWIARFLPLLDLPNHLMNIAVWHNYENPIYDFKEWYIVNKHLLPYWAHYYSAHLLAYVVSIETANKIFLTAYALTLPLGALGLALRFGRSPWLSLFAFPLVWNFNLADGFIAYCGGMAALVCGLAIVARHCDRPTIRSAIAVVAIGTLTYLCHLLTYTLFLVLAGLVVLAWGQLFHVKRLLARGLPVVGGTAIGLWAFTHQDQMQFHRVGGNYEWLWEDATRTLSRLPGRTLNFLSSSRDEWVVVVLALAWLAIVVVGARGAAPPDGPAERLRWRRGLVALALLVGATCLAILLAPRSLLRPWHWYMINLRWIPIALVLLALLGPRRVVGRRRWLFAPVVVASLFYLGDIARGVVGFNRRLAGWDEVLAEVPYHKKTLVLSMQPRGDVDFNVHAFNQWPAYVLLARGGFNHYKFDHNFPLIYKKMLPAPSWNNAEGFNFDSMAPYWDYFLTHNDGVQRDTFGPLERAGKVELVIRRGPWALWKKKGPADPTPPDAR
jgi:hypothetical protein